jgi:CRP-like cAMP-binding protein
MVLDWISKRRPPSVDELVALGKYAQAAAVLRAEMQGRAATLTERLRLADLLVLSGHGRAALPVLIEVADELARYGFNERALEALRRADAVAPEHPDVRARFESLARAARARAASATATSRGLDAKTDPFVDSSQAGPPAAIPPEPEQHGALPVDRELFAFVRELGDRAGRGLAPGNQPAHPRGLAAALFSDLQRYLFRATQEGLHRRHHPAGAIVVSEGDHGDSLFLIARGSVRILVVGGHGRPLEIRRLDAPDFFGEVSALSGEPRSATVVAVEECELLEVDRGALERLVEARPAAREILEGAREGRTHSAEEAAVRALPETASPERAAAVLAAHFGGSEWSPRVRLHLAKQMLDAGQENDALAVIASVAEDLAQGGHAEQAIAILKKVDQARRREDHGRTKHPSRAVTEAAFRMWVGSIASEAERLAPAAATAAEQKHADGEHDR